MSRALRIGTTKRASRRSGGFRDRTRGRAPGGEERGGAAAPPDCEEGVVVEPANEIRPEEIREFLEADLLDVVADPEFKEWLRQHLWSLLLEGRRSGRPRT